VAKYEIDFRDAAAITRKSLLRNLLVPLVVVIAGLGLAALSGGAAGLVMLGFALGVGTAQVCEAYLDHGRVKALYREKAGPIELKIGTDRLEFTTPASTTLIRRTPATRVVDSGSVFLVTTSQEGPPILVPARHLSQDEAALLREWARSTVAHKAE
jgi:hypothetical protein